MEDVHARFIRALEQPAAPRPRGRAPARRRDARRPAQRRASASPCPSSPCCSPTPRSRSRSELLACPLPDDPDLIARARRATSPPPLRERFLDRIRDASAAARDHRDRARERPREPGRASRSRSGIAEETGASGADIVRAHEAARAIVGQEALWRDIEALDGHDRRRRADRDVPRVAASSSSARSRWLLRHRAAAAAGRRDRRVLRTRVRTAGGDAPAVGAWQRARPDGPDDRRARGNRARPTARGPHRRPRPHARRVRHHRARGRDRRRPRPRGRALHDHRRPAPARLAARPHRRAPPQRPLGRARPQRAAGGRGRAATRHRGCRPARRRPGEQRRDRLRRAGARAGQSPSTARSRSSTTSRRRASTTSPPCRWPSASSAPSARE